MNWWEDPKRIQYDDDLIIVLDDNGDCIYRGIFDYWDDKEALDEGSFEFSEEDGKYLGVGNYSGYSIEKLS